MGRDLIKNGSGPGIRSRFKAALAKNSLEREKLWGFSQRIQAPAVYADSFRAGSSVGRI
jgi:hypothetical protein